MPFDHGGGFTDLVVGLLRLKTFLREDHPESEEEHDEAMAGVSEHHREEEREADDGVGSCNITEKRNGKLMMV